MPRTLTDRAPGLSLEEHAEQTLPGTARVPRLGDRVFYRLDDSDVRAIHRQRLTSHVRAAPVRRGDVLPAVIVRVSSSTAAAPCNLTVFLDGPDTYWAQQVVCGSADGCWAWPARQEA